MITPLKKHRGQSGAVIAAVLLIAATAVVLTTHPKPKGEPKEEVTKLETIAPLPAATMPAPEITTVARERSRVLEGVVTYDEHVTSHLFAPVSGWVTNIKGARRVRAGETIGSLHSVDVVVAQRALVDQVEHFSTQDLLDNERRRLMRWGMRRDAIQRVEQTKKVTAALPLIAPRDGTIAVKPAVPGMFVESSQTLFTITNPGRAWVIVDLDELEDIRAGTKAKLTIAGKTFAAKVAAVYKTIGKARFDLAGSYTPGTPVTVDFTP